MISTIHVIRSYIDCPICLPNVVINIMRFYFHQSTKDLENKGLADVEQGTVTDGRWHIVDWFLVAFGR